MTLSGAPRRRSASLLASMGVRDISVSLIDHITTCIFVELFRKYPPALLPWHLRRELPRGPHPTYPPSLSPLRICTSATLLEASKPNWRNPLWQWSPPTFRL